MRIAGGSWRIWIAWLGLLVATAAGCSTSVHGHGRVAQSSHGFPASSSPTSEALSCAPVSIEPSGAPFCYTLPKGWRDYSYLNNYGASWTWRTLIAVGIHDLITVVATEMPKPIDQMTQTEFYYRLGAQHVLQEARFGVTYASEFTPVMVGRYSAFQQTVSYTSGVQMLSYVVFRGRTELNLRCEGLSQQHAVDSACQQILAEIQIKSL